MPAIPRWLIFTAGIACGTVLTRVGWWPRATETLPGGQFSGAASVRPASPVSAAVQQGLQVKGEATSPTEATPLPMAGPRAPGMAASRAQVARRMEERRHARIEEKTAALAQRLNLTAEQRPQVRALLDKHFPPAEATLNAFLAPEDNTKETQSLFAALGAVQSAERSEALAEDLAQVLTPEQEDQFTEFKRETLGDQIESTVNQELAQLQAFLTLSPEQKDQIFKVLQPIVQEEIEVGPEVYLDPLALPTRSESRLQSLQGILTAEQLVVYEGQIEGVLANATPPSLVSALPTTDELSLLDSE